MLPCLVTAALVGCAGTLPEPAPAEVPALSAAQPSRPETRRPAPDLLQASPPDEVRARLGAVEVVAGAGAPGVRVSHPAEGAVDGGASGCLLGCLVGLQAPPFGPPLGALVGGVWGAGAGAAAGLDASQRVQAETALRCALAAAGGSKGLAGEVSRALHQRVGPNASSEGTRPILDATVEEVCLQALPHWEKGPKPSRSAHSLVLSAAVRLAAAPGRTVVYERSVVAHGPPVVAKDWLHEPAERVKEQLVSLVLAAAEQIADEVAWLYVLPGQDHGPTAGGAGLRSGFGLRVIDLPSTMRAFPLPAVDSLRPTLSWEVFPRVQDRELAPDIAHGVADVVYDLRLAPVAAHHKGGWIGVPSDVVYARDDLPEPRHAVEEALWASRTYFWTVRARFTLDGQPRATEWAAPDGRGRRTAPPLNSYSHRFMTPR